MDSSDLRRRVRRRAEIARWRALDAAAGTRRRVTPGRVALTFDDGPHVGSTDLVLDALARSGVQATFFCVGRNALRHPDLVRRMDAEGHAVGSHSMTHPTPSQLSWRALADEYLAGRRAVSQALGRDTALFRPPHGHHDTASSILVRHLGLEPWLWTVDPEDWRPGTLRTRVLEVAGGASSGDVVLMHDWVEQPEGPEAEDRSATVDAVRDVVDRLHSQGYRLVRVSR